MRFVSRGPNEFFSKPFVSDIEVHDREDLGKLGYTDNRYKNKMTGKNE